MSKKQISLPRNTANELFNPPLVTATNATTPQSELLQLHTLDIDDIKPVVDAFLQKSQDPEKLKKAADCLKFLAGKHTIVPVIKYVLNQYTRWDVVNIMSDADGVCIYFQINSSSTCREVAFDWSKSSNSILNFVGEHGCPGPPDSSSVQKKRTPGCHTYLDLSTRIAYQCRIGNVVSETILIPDGIGVQSVPCTVIRNYERPTFWAPRIYKYTLTATNATGLKRCYLFTFKNALWHITPIAEQSSSVPVPATEFSGYVQAPPNPKQKQ